MKRLILCMMIVLLATTAHAKRYGDINVSGGKLELPNSTALPASANCDEAAEAGKIYIDTNETTAQQIFICEGAAGWTQQNVAATAAALTSDPADCAANEFADAIAANGDLTCNAIVDADVPDIYVYNSGDTVDGELDIAMDAAADEINISQSAVAGTEGVPLIFIDDDRTGATANTGTEASLVIDAEGSWGLNVADGMAQFNGGTTYLNAGAIIGDDQFLNMGAASEWLLEYDESVDDQLLLHSTKTAAVATTDPMFEVLADFGTADGTNMTANQQIFGVAKGTQASNVSLFTVDEDGDAILTGDLRMKDLDLANSGSTGIITNTAGVIAFQTDATWDDGKAVGLGSTIDWQMEYDEATDDQLLLHTSKTGAVATTDPMFEVLADFGTATGSNMTADQQIFGVAKGTQASNVSLFTVDEDGDVFVDGQIRTVDSASYLWLAGTASQIYLAGAAGGSISYVADDGLHLNTKETEGEGNNNIIIGNYLYQLSDYDHATTSTNPTLFIHSNTDPDSANDEWISLTHDQTDGVIDVGSGTINLGSGTTQTILPLSNDAVTPTLAFGDGDTGFYESSDDILWYASSGGAAWSFRQTSIQSSNSGGANIIQSGVSDTVPTLVPRRDDTDTGIGAAGADQLSLIAGGVEMMQLDSTSIDAVANIGIHRASQQLRIYDSDSADPADFWTLDFNNNELNIRFWDDSGSAFIKGLVIDNDGSVAVGTGVPGLATGAGDLYVTDQLEVAGTSYFGANVTVGHDLKLILGNAGFVGSTGFDQMLFYTEDGLGRQFVIGDYASRNKDFDHDAPANPTLFVHSVTDPDTANDEWISMTHDVTDGVIDVGSGGLKLNGANVKAIDGIFQVGNASNPFTLYTDGFKPRIAPDPTTNQLQLVASGNLAKNHDHADQTNPTLFIHSATDPDTANDEWISMTHDVTNGVINTGSGSLVVGGGTPARAISSGELYATGDIESGGVFAGGEFTLFTGIQDYLRIKTFIDDGSHFALGESDGNANHNLILTSRLNFDKNHDHNPASATPTLFVHSDTDPDTANDEWISLTHDVTNGVIDIGSGQLELDIAGTNILTLNPAYVIARKDLAFNDGEHIIDFNLNELIKLGQTASAVNEITVTNAATGNAPEISATGDNTDIDLKLTAKGVGAVNIDAASNALVARKFTFTVADLTAANTQELELLLNIPAGARVADVYANVNTAFTGGGASNCYVSVGDTDSDGLAKAHDVFGGTGWILEGQDATDKGVYLFDATNHMRAKIYTAATDINAKFTSDVNLNTLTTGSIDIYLVYQTAL